MDQAISTEMNFINRSNCLFIMAHLMKCYRSTEKRENLHLIG